MDFSKWMTEERQKRKWNRQRVADKVGVHVNTIGRWEREGDSIPLGMAKEIAQIFGAELTICK